MDKYKYDIYFVGDTHIDFTTDVDMDFHKITPTAIAYNELYINMANVTFMKKKPLCCGNCRYYDDEGCCSAPGNELRVFIPKDDPACGNWKEKNN